jgi:predicted transglutaminase-like cysteine proteinase
MWPKTDKGQFRDGPAGCRTVTIAHVRHIRSAGLVSPFRKIRRLFDGHFQKTRRTCKIVPIDLSALQKSARMVSPRQEKRTNGPPARTQGNVDMLKIARIAMLAAAGVGILAGVANASMLGSASRFAGVSIVAKAGTISRDRQVRSFDCTFSDCRAGEEKLAFSSRLYLTMTLVNQSINDRQAPAIELRAYWPTALLPRNGEDAARAKRDRLVREGLPADALRLVTLDEEDGRHMVLVVETVAGDFVLDSRRARVIKQELDEGHTASIKPALPHFRLR